MSDTQNNKGDEGTKESRMPSFLPGVNQGTNYVLRIFK